jgi:hypothetical protein
MGKVDVEEEETEEEEDPYAVKAVKQVVGTVDIETIVANEMTEFHLIKPHNFSLRFGSWMAFLEKRVYAPLEFWTIENQVKFPRIFLINMLTLTLPTTSIMQESVFSSAGDTLDSRRKRILESPLLLEQIVTLRYILNQQLRSWVKRKD